ncbi:MAG: Ig-like domain-containing protein [Methanofastidiosum sp.]|jgi:hypothetical protein|nr:Ig-like domain-containing protein [Methanofastidiosum sp.]
MTRKRFISGLIIFVLMLTVFTVFTLAENYDEVVYTYTNSCCNNNYPDGNTPWLNLSDVLGLGPDWRIAGTSGGTISSSIIQAPTNGGVYVASGDYDSGYNTGYPRLYYVMRSRNCCGTDEFIIRVRLRTGPSAYDYKNIKYIVTCPPENITLECGKCIPLDLCDISCLSTSYEFSKWVVSPDGRVSVSESKKSITYCAPSCGGTDTMIFEVKSGSTHKYITVNVLVNCGGPTANDDSYTILENTCTDFPVTLNDVAGDLPIKVSWVSNPTYGTVTIKDDNTITYCPTANYCGEDTFIYQISDGGCGTDTATVTVTISCKTPLPETVLYPNLGLETLSIPATGANIISDGKIISALEVIPGTQRVLVEVENRGMVTQAEVKITLQGLPEGVTYTLDPELQKITAHNIGTFSLTITASADVPAGTYPVVITASSLRGSLDKKTINVVIQ